MNLYYLAFSGRGLALARRLADALGGEAVRCGGPVTLAGWTAEHFAPGAGLVYVGACGIAVRAVAPHLTAKDKDPAVVAIDEQGHFAVPLVSGHLGGANALARQIAAACGAVPVVTTATDAGGLFPVDDWARAQGCAIPDTKRIKAFSAALLAGKPRRIRSDWPIAGTPPKGVELVTGDTPCDAALSFTDPGPGILWMVPRIVTVGIGCRRGVTAARLEEALTAALTGAGIPVQAVAAVCTIDRKADEPGLLELCQTRRWPLRIYTADQLNQVEGTFTPSAFVARTVGVDNVCERAAVLGAAGGPLLLPKQAGDGVTLALARMAFGPDWKWNQ